VIKENKSAVKGFAKQYTIDGIEGIDALTFLSKVKLQVPSLLEKNRMNKINMVLTGTMELIDIKSGEIITNDDHFVSKTEVVLAGTDMNELYKKASEKCLESMAKYQRRGSGFRFKFVVRLDINTVIYKPLKGRSYIKTPPKLANKKANINIKNKNDQCFKW